MSQPEQDKNEVEKSSKLAQEKARERELRTLIDQVEQQKSGTVRPGTESPHDFVERKMREKPGK